VEIFIRSHNEALTHRRDARQQSRLFARYNSIAATQPKTNALALYRR
jgi:hypothetical protein